jgi:hypothetical protein
VSVSDNFYVCYEIEEVNAVHENSRCSIQDKHRDAVFKIFGCLSLLVHKVTNETFSDNTCRQKADILLEMLSGTLEGNIVSVFLLQNIVSNPIMKLRYTWTSTLPLL